MARPAHASWEALGTTVVLRVGAPAELARARAEVERELRAIDVACSRFREDSELSRVNRARGAWVAISPLLAEALELALRAAELTGGDVDPTVGRALELSGYDRDWSELSPAPAAPPHGDPAHGDPARGERASGVRARVRAGWREVSLDGAAGRVRVPAGMRLDLGASAKAWAADRAARAAAGACGCGALVSVGGDVASAGAAPAGGWRIRVTDDHRSGESADGQTISIVSGGLATSSTAVRRWLHRGGRMHHIIDPATGAPARTRWRTVSVAAASCVDANTASTAALVRGAGAERWLAQLQLPARLVDNDGGVTAVAGWPQR